MKTITLFTALFLLCNTLFAQTALEFENTNNNQSVSIADITCPQNFTFEAWINWKGTSTSYVTLLEFANDDPWIGIYQNKLSIVAIGGSIYAPIELPVNQWVHVAATYDSDNLYTAKLFINGVLVANNDYVLFALGGVGAGIGKNVGDFAFDGMIDEVKLWDIAKTDAEVLANINNCYSGTEPNLYAYYTFNEIEGTEVDDLSNNDFDAVMLNMDPDTDYVASEFCPLLNTNDHATRPALTLYPNPAQEYIYITGLETTTSYTIYSITGLLLAQGNITNNRSIPVENLTAGQYFIQLQNGQTLQFIKK